MSENTFNKNRKLIEKDRDPKYKTFWDDCPLPILKNHLAFKALRATYIDEPQKLMEEMIDIANYSEKVYQRTMEKIFGEDQ